jgi:phosphoglycolate phosphatase-like HAD superfamily hydrolase
MDVAVACGVPDTAEKIMKTVKQEAVSAYLRDLSAACGKGTDELMQMYRTVSHAKMDGITLIPGAAETLAALQAQGVRHFVYTHRGSSTTHLLNRLGLTGYFTEIVTHEHGFTPKPSGEGVNYLTEKYALDKAATAYIGDRTLDVLCAKDAGARAVLFLPEGTPVAPTGKEDRIIGRLEELLEEELLEEELLEELE